MVQMSTTATFEVDDLRSRFRGTIVLPRDPDYDVVRTVWNAMIDRRPGIIARCRSAFDVASALQFGIEHGFQISVRGGGHNVAGSCLVDDGLTIDLSLMKGIRIAPEPGLRGSSPECSGVSSIRKPRRSASPRLVALSLIPASRD